MPTEKPKISAYVNQEIFDDFKAYQEANGLTMSEATGKILAQYFGHEEIESESAIKRISDLEIQLQSVLERLTKIEKKQCDRLPNSKVEQLSFIK